MSQMSRGALGRNTWQKNSQPIGHLFPDTQRKRGIRNGVHNIRKQTKVQSNTLECTTQHHHSIQKWQNKKSASVQQLHKAWWIYVVSKVTRNTTNQKKQKTKKKQPTVKSFSHQREAQRGWNPAQPSSGKETGVVFKSSSWRCRAGIGHGIPGNKEPGGSPKTLGSTTHGRAKVCLDFRWRQRGNSHLVRRRQQPKTENINNKM